MKIGIILDKKITDDEEPMVASKIRTARRG
jgi:hypothetical protein